MGKTYVIKWTRRSDYRLPENDDITKIIIKTPPQSVESIRELYLCGNRVVDFRNSWKLSNVDFINMDNCEFDFIPGWITSLPQLEEVLMADNNIREIPRNIFTVQSLKKIDLAGCNIKNLPCDFFCHHLERVIFSENRGI